jgi:hypothetical protein
MNRRTFTQQSTKLSLIACFSPLLALADKQSIIPPETALTPLMQQHLDHFANGMQQNMGALSPQMIERYVKPVRILRSETTAEAYYLEYTNRYGDTICLFQKAGRSFTKIT